MLRNANPNDAAAIAQIFRLARAEAMPWLPVIHSPDAELSFFSKIVLPNEDVRVVETQDGVAGFAAIQSAWLTHLYIHPQVWGSGCGSRLLGDAKAKSARLQLWTFQRNKAARAFYTRRGFVETERTDGAGNEERTPDVKMVWEADGR